MGNSSWKRLLRWWLPGLAFLACWSVSPLKQENRRAHIEIRVSRLVSVTLRNRPRHKALYDRVPEVADARGSKHMNRLSVARQHITRHHQRGAKFPSLVSTTFHAMEECAYVYPRGYRHGCWAIVRWRITAPGVRELQRVRVGKGDAVVYGAVLRAEWVAAFWGCALCEFSVPIVQGANAEYPLAGCAGKDEARHLCARASGGFRIPAIAPGELLTAFSGARRMRFVRPAIGSAGSVFTSGTAEPKGVCSQRQRARKYCSHREEIKKYLVTSGWSIRYAF
jgi:hypothetical protein